MSDFEIIQGDCVESLRAMPDGVVRCVVTSPPYFGLRDYGVDGQIGLEGSPEEYVAKLVSVFAEVRRVMADDGTLWLNLGDSYATAGGGAGTQGKNSQRAGRTFTAEGSSAKGVPIGLKPKDLIGIPWRVAFALQADGWYLRSDIIWHKPNPMPESVTDRPTKAHEYLFLLAKSERYYYDAAAIRESLADQRQGCDGSTKASERNRSGRSDGLTKPNGIDPSKNGGRNCRSVWTIAPRPFREAHFATFPVELPERCLRAGSALGDLILDPFNGAATTGVAALRNRRRYVGLEINPEYVEMSRSRLNAVHPEMAL